MTQQSAVRIVAVLAACFITDVLIGVQTNAAPVPKHLMKEAENPEEAKFQGKWKLESFSIGGKQFLGGVAQQMEMTLEFQGSKLTTHSTDRVVTATIKLDITDGMKRIALNNTKAVNSMGKPVEEEDVLFGYCIDGDKLSLATTLNDKGKKAVDPTKPGDDTIVLVLTRIKEKN